MRKTMVSLVFISFLLLISIASAQQQAVFQKGNLVLFPKITSVSLDYEGEGPLCEIDIGGQNFGATRGTRTVIVDGTPITDASKYINWSNTSITIRSTGMPTFIMWDHEYLFRIGAGANPTSNTFKVRFLVQFDEISPPAAPANSIVEARGLLMVASQNDKILKLKTTTISSSNIISWTSTILKFRVPPMAPGAYQFYIMKGSNIISEKINFTVQ